MPETMRRDTIPSTPGSRERDAEKMLELVIHHARTLLPEERVYEICRENLRKLGPEEVGGV